MSEQKQRVYDALNKLGIKYEVVEHEPVHTMEDMDRLGLPEKGTLCKNLFLRDAKGKRHFLITCDENAKVDLKSLGRQLGAGNLSFASEERLEKYLGLKQGSVSPFGLMNDTDHAVEFFIDTRLFNICVPKSTFCDTIKQAKKGAIFYVRTKAARL